MIDTYRPTIAPTAQQQLWRNNITWAMYFLGFLGFTAAVAFLAYRSGGITVVMIPWLLFLMVIATIIYQPRYGVYLIVGLSIVGDARLTPWYPFVKNLSSGESIMYLSHAVSFSPAELTIGLTLAVWLIRAAIRRDVQVRTGPLFWPVALFTMFITIGLLYGLGRGGNFRAALWEVRTIYYLPMVFLLASNLLETRNHVKTLFWVFIIAQTLDAMSGAMYVATVLGFNTSAQNEIAEHAFSIQINALILLMIVQFMFGGSLKQAGFILATLPFTLLAYVGNQRRAAYLTLGIALALIGITLFFANRRLFWKIAPFAITFSVIYIIAFWNSSGSLGAPARAIRSVVSPVEGSRDDGSNLYRVIENINIAYNIHVMPLTGVGFGNKFIMIVPLPDISFFEFWEYITHNSILWMWMQIGLFGFLAMLSMIGGTLMSGMRTLFRVTDRYLWSACLVATLYIAMHFVYSYVDMGWDAQSMILVGAFMGLISNFDLIAARTPPEQTIIPPWAHSAVQNRFEP